LRTGSERRRFVGLVSSGCGGHRKSSGQADGVPGTAGRVNSFCKRLVNPIQQYSANIAASWENALSSSLSAHGAGSANPDSPSACPEGLRWLQSDRSAKLQSGSHAGQRVPTAFTLVRGGLGVRARCSSGPAHVAASTCIDPDQFTFFNKQGDLNHFTGL